MEFKKEKQVRFHSDGKQKFELSWEKREAQHQDNQLPFYKASVPSMKSEGRFNEKTRANVIPKFGKSKVFPEGNYETGKKWVLDPGSEIVLKWNRIFLFFCSVALFVDPLFFYVPSELNDSNSNTSCMTRDMNLAIIVTCIRTVVDVFYVLHVFIKFRTAYVSPSSRVFGKGELVMDPNMIAERYLKSDFLIDVIAALPLPQIVIWCILPAIKSSHTDHTNNALVAIVLFQYMPRLYLIFPLSSQIIKATGLVAKTAWAGAAYNLLLYMLASHVSGAAWYLFAIVRDGTCWKSACREELSSLGCSLTFLDCGTMDDNDRITWANATAVYTNCVAGNTTFFNYGIFGPAVSNNILSANFLVKYVYCFFWGLQSLSSYAQPLIASAYVWEDIFTILISSLGIVLLAHLIGNVQNYLQSLTVRLEKWRLRKRDTEEWMRHRQLHPDLQDRVRRFVHYKWLTTRGVDEESILHALPADLHRDIQRHVRLNLVLQVPFFSQMDNLLLDAICERLVSSLSIQGSYIVREGDPVTEMLFIIRGTLDSSTTNGGRTGFFNSITLGSGDFCGEELLSWALLPKSALNLPSSTRTVRTLTEVEAFALKAEDLKFVANQFRRLHSKKLQHTFRYYSHHWRTWAACFIQVAWRRHKKGMMAECLSTKESFSLAQDEQLADGNEPVEEVNKTTPSSTFQAKQNLGVAIIASMFAANARRRAQKTEDDELPKLQKPEDPDFSAYPDDE